MQHLDSCYKCFITNCASTGRNTASSDYLRAWKCPYPHPDINQSNVYHKRTHLWRQSRYVYNQHEASQLTLTGLGRAFVEQYLARPNHTVIGTVRDTNNATANELHALPTAKGSKLLLVKVEYTSTTDAAEAVKTLEAAGVEKLDIVIANAGISGQQGPMETIDPKGLADVYLVNVVGPAILFLALKPLLDKSEAPKWMSISTALASLQDIDKYPMFRGFPYNGSKAALNHFTRSIHSETNIIAFTISPG